MTNEDAVRLRSCGLRLKTLAVLRYTDQIFVSGFTEIYNTTTGKSQ